MAVGIVVVFHYFPQILPGGYVGVDIFFVISGYLITLHLLQRSHGNFSQELLTFFKKRALRLAPMGLLVLSAIFICTLVLVPQSEKVNNFIQIIASSVAVENWNLALNSVDYVHQSDAPSLTQHFWSLSVEEQFYVFWAVLMLISLKLLQTGRDQFRKLLATSLTVLILSLIISVVWTLFQKESAYFSTFTRVWEFGFGAIWAIVYHQSSTIKTLGNTSWFKSLILVVCYSAIFGSALLFNADTNFPGVIALIPVSATLVIIVLGSTNQPQRSSNYKVLSPILGLGNISYSLYLWHWPILLCALIVFGSNITATTKLFFLAFAVGLSVISWMFIEKKFQQIASQNQLNKIVKVLISTLITLIVLATIAISITHKFQENNNFINATSPGCLGAEAVVGSNCPNAFESKALMDPGYAATDYAQNTFDDCSEGHEIGRLSDAPICAYGDINAQQTILLVGDSHAGQWLPAIIKIAERHDLKVITTVRSSCFFNNIAPFVPGDVEGACQQWQKETLDYILKASPNYVVIAGLSPYGYEFGKAVLPEYPILKSGFKSVLSQIVSNGSSIFIIKDTPYMEESIPTCVSKYPDPKQCRKNRQSVLDNHVDLLAEAGHEVAGVSVIDLNNFICDQEFCYSTVGGLIVFRDHQHITKSFAESLSNQLSKAMNFSH